MKSSKHDCNKCSCLIFKKHHCKIQIIFNTENKNYASFHRLSDDFDRKVGLSKNCTLILISSMKLKSWPDSNSCNTFYKLPLLCRGLNSKWEMEAYSHEIWKTSYCTLEEVRSERILSKVSHRWSDPLPAHFFFVPV